MIARILTQSFFSPQNKEGIIMSFFNQFFKFKVA